MGRLAILIRMVIMAAFVVSAFAPAMSGAQQTGMDHAQMMSMVGHAASMDATGGDAPDSQQIMVCKQYCMVASAVLPVEIRPALIDVTYAMLPRPGVIYAPSRVTAPPGRPPKLLMV